jgi:ubiquinone/menaquinone biosynthesis C-methylase UbiE
MTEVQVREQYNSIADIYDRRWRTYISNTLSFLKNWANIPATNTVLDIACGTGELESLLLNEEPNRSIVGIDISENMLAIAQNKCQKYPHVSFAIANASALPFPDSRFDTIVSANAFHFFDRPDIVLQEIKRVIKPEGKIVIIDWCRDFWWCKICNIYLKVVDRAHRQCYTQKEFHNLIINAKLRINRADKFRFGLFWGLMIVELMPEGDNKLI